MDIKVFDKLLSKEMSRKEFLVHLGLIVLTLTGIVGIIKTIKNPHMVNGSKDSQTFGGGSYGGTRKENT